MSAEETFPLARAELIALFLESMMFGAFTVLYAIAIWILLYREKVRGRSTLNRALFGTTTIMWLLSVAHLAIDVTRAIKGFVEWGGTPNGTNDFYGRISDPTFVAKNVVYITMTLVADFFVTYRLFVVWGRVWWILIGPCILLLATAVAGYGACVEIGLAQEGNAIFADNLQPWIRAFFSLSLTTNLLATLLIAARIMWSNRRVRKYRANGAAVGSHWEVVETMIQSAAVYSAALASLLGTYLAGSNAQYICVDILQPLIGVVFTLIIIRVGLGYTMNDSVSGGGAGGNISDRAGPASHLQTIGGHAYPLQPVAINVSVSRTHDRASFDGYDQKGPRPDISDVESGKAPSE
ncbi:hypothetical protein TRAPUB_11194 [Trametes pubescens]|uniref:Uncharacterized protein n=1 Tax=Trametes pubescens TaxID=154538 RepID=A0A1M2VXK0_TRAPU|nr:hypothetical protein TRAPUB_11194 [Trametes pubescens]